MKYFFPVRFNKVKKLFMHSRKNLLIFIFFVLICFVDKISTEPYYHDLSFLNELKKCFESDNEDKCKEMILVTERMQLGEYYKGNLKCQTSILGLQTELIRNIYFDREKDNLFEKTIPSLIKNC